MPLTHHLTQSERDVLTQNINDKQKRFIDAYLKRGRKTVFANVLAKEKASHVDDGNIEEVANQWELLDYIDAGPNWKRNAKYFCECGRLLRYQYIVENKETGELKKFGITHFEEHVGIPPQLVREIVKGIETIDYERDEILLKIANNWTLDDEQIGEIPAEIEVPRDIQQQLNYDVPLLDRQVRRLRAIVSEYYREQERHRFERRRQQQEAEKQQRQQELAKRREKLQQDYAKRREEIGKKLGWHNGSGLDQSLQLGVMVYLENLDSPNFLASEVCENLVTYHEASSERFSSGTLKIFPEVCNFLEQLVKQGVLSFVGKENGLDRVYEVVGEV